MLTIPRETQPPPDPHTLALSALAWSVAEEARARRLLDLTGLTADGLRAGVGDPSVLGAVLDFLAAHEPDLVACAQSLQVDPAALIAARKDLSR